MAPLFVSIALALLPAHSARAAHDSLTSAQRNALEADAALASQVVWLDDQMRFLDAAPSPLPVDPPAYLGSTPIEVRSGFTGRAVLDVETLRF